MLTQELRYQIARRALEVGDHRECLAALHRCDWREGDELELQAVRSWFKEPGVWKVEVLRNAQGFRVSGQDGDWQLVRHLTRALEWQAEFRVPVRTHTELEAAAGRFSRQADNLAKTAQGFWKGGKPPYGYRGVKAEDGKHTRLEPDPFHGAVMARVFEMVATGNRSEDVMAFIREKTGERWQWQTFYARLKNPIYHGLLEYGRTSLQKGRHRLKNDEDELVQGRVPPLVSKEIWGEANAKVEERQVNSTRGRTPKRVYLLSEGVATCATCGRNLTGSTWHGSRAYVCSGRKNELCSMRGKVFADELEAAVYQVFAEELQRFDIDGFIENYAASLAPRLDEAKQREAKLRKELTEVRKKIKNIVNAVAQGFAVDEMRTAMDDLKAEEKVLAEEIATCQLAEEQSVKFNVEMVKSYVSSFADLVPELTPEELKEFLGRNLRLEWDLEKQEGQLYLKLTPDNRRSVNLSFEPPRKPYGRSGPTWVFP